jgi:hypothetical protein
MKQAFSAVRESRGGGKYYNPIRIYIGFHEYEPDRVTTSNDWCRIGENKRATRRVRTTLQNAEALCNAVNSGKIDFKTAKKVFINERVWDEDFNVNKFIN